MTWNNIGSLNAHKREWQLTSNFSGNLILIENNVSSVPEMISNFRGLIALNYDLDYFYDIKQVFSIPKKQLILFKDIDLGVEKRVAMRNISRLERPNTWNVNVYIWNSIIN